ncbi:hypothetical protein SAMN05421863_102340 [Nitrosomonas communis]|uniref:Uncharacterized protein n=1 Tax=Nitrosomonas communis TaxID=44574 RepID=A0A1I4PWY7_9PROT|nr:hypothetical protein SAMN05421863_102340 [Nitrosomonas communis]
MIEIITSMIKMEFSFLKWQIKVCAGSPLNFANHIWQISERFNTVNISLTSSEFFVTMMHSEVFIKADINLDE